MMPSLLKYFAIVGGVLLSVLYVANAVLEPGGPGPTFVKVDTPAGKSVITVQHDPRASKVERLRAEEDAAAKARVAAQTGQVESVVQVVEPPMPKPVQAAFETPAQISAAASLVAPATAAAPAADDAANAAQLAADKLKAEKEKARKAKLARERAKAKALEEASAQHAQPAYGYAPRPVFGPFAQGGGWSRW